MATEKQSGPSTDPTDLAKMWQKAVDDYQKVTKKDLKLEPFRSMDEVMKGTERQMQKFGGMRHDQSKVDKVRSAFGRNVGNIQKFVNVIESVGNAASAFPPAMPVCLVFTACSHVLGAFSSVSADYDKVEAFFAKTERFFDRLSILEEKSPPQGAFERCVIRVFSCILSICAIAQDLAGKRLKKFFAALWDGSDKDLEAAFSTMESAIEELGETVGMASYVEIRRTKEAVDRTHVKLDQVNVSVQDLNEKAEQTNVGIHSIQTNVLEMTTEVHETHVQGRETHADVKEVKAMMTQLLSKQSIQLRQTQAKEKPDKKQKQQTAKSDLSDKKHIVVNRIKKHFSGNDRYQNWELASKYIKTQQKELAESFVPGTASWLVEDDEKFRAWVSDGPPILWVTGEDGVGKTFLAYQSAQKLASLTEDQDRTSVASFYFKDDYPYLRNKEVAWASAAWQIAQDDAKYAGIMAADIKNPAETEDITWKRFFTSRYLSSSDAKLYLVLDGLNEVDEDVREDIINDLTQIKADGLNIRVLITSKPDLRELVQRLEPSVVEVEKEGLSTDISLLIKARCKTIPRLKKFSSHVKKTILRKLKSKADSMLYAEHMLRRLSYIGREGAVLKDLKENLPDDLHSLYELMLRECRKNRTESQYKALKRLFAWLAYSKRQLTLAEAAALVNLTDQDKSFDIEDEIIGRSARILELSHQFDDEDDDVEAADGKSEDIDSHEDDDKEDVDEGNIEYRKTRLTFQERSLREYFRAIDVDEGGLRTPASSAHLTILEMCADILINHAQSNNDEHSALVHYAANYWYDHLVEIDLERATDEDIVTVLQSIRSFTENTANIARVFEKYTVYSQELYPEKTGETWLDFFDKCIQRAAAMPDGALPAKLKEWVDETNKSPNELLRTLSKGHCKNWATELRRGAIFEAFDFAFFALHRCSPVPRGYIAHITAVMNNIQPDNQDAGVLRAIGATYTFFNSEHNISEDDPDPADQAVSYLSQSMEKLPEGKSIERFQTLQILSQAYKNKGLVQESIDKSKEAYKALPEDWKEQQKSLVEDDVRPLLIQQAGSHASLDQTEEAIATYNEARALDEDVTLGGYVLDDMARVYNWTNDPTGLKYFELFQSWSERERFDLYDYMFENQDDISIEHLCRAAKSNGKEAIQFLLDSWAAYERTLVPRSVKLINTRVELGYFYWRVIDDPDKAKEIFGALLKTKIRQEDLDRLEWTLSIVRLSLADIIFADFMASPDHQRKAALLQEIKNIPTVSETDDMHGSHLGVIMSIMSRIVGPAEEFQDHMQKTFAKCMEDLTDSVGWNDSDGLRLLAKILANLKGLERDALIAVSCQFSVFDKELYKDKEEAENDEEGEGSQESESENSVEGEEETKIDEHTNGDETTSEASDPDADTDGTGPSVAEANGVNTPAITAETTHVEIEATDGNKVVSVEVTETVVQTEDSSADDAGSEAKGAEEEGNKEEAEDLFAAGGSPGEDLNSDYGVGCDGVCGKSMSSWKYTFYYCITCRNTDLCEECRDKRLAQSRGEEVEGLWRSFCGKGHKYIKGPMKGWKGVKDGVIRIEGEEDLPVKQWLKELQEERWPKAWEQFWLRSGWLRDIEG